MSQIRILQSDSSKSVFWLSIQITVLTSVSTMCNRSHELGQLRILIHMNASIIIALA